MQKRSTNSSKKFRRVLGPDFFDRPTLTVARDLIGKFIVRKLDGKEIALLINETEAYDGMEDLACHASRGQTPRNTPMFDEPGTVYVYFTYGMHWMLNLVCRKRGYPAAALIRGAGEVSGPARLTKFLQIDKSLNHQALGKKAGPWIEDRDIDVPPYQIQRTPRIGITYAGEWAHKPWRFVVKKYKAGTCVPARAQCKPKV